MTVKEELHQLVDTLSEHDLSIVRRLLRGLALTQEQKEDDSLLVFLESCPEDDEPTTEDDLAAVARGRKALLSGDLISHKAVVQRSGGHEGAAGLREWNAKSARPKSRLGW